MAFGLRIRSELALPELTRGGEGTPDVEVRLGSAPGTLPGATQVGRRGWATPGAFLFEVPGVARYLVSDGSQVVIEPLAGAAESPIRTYLLGSVFGALCYQRGMIPLHANALAVAGRCVAVAGPSEAGKSTLAAHLSRRGYAVMGDDICALDFRAGDRVMTWPGARRFKLWSDAMAALGWETKGLEKVVDGRDKFVAPHHGEAPTGATRFEALYVLKKAAPGAGGAIRLLAGKEAFEAVIANIYRLEIATAMGRRAEVFGRVIDTLRQARVFEFTRRWGLDRLAEEAELLEAHIGAAPTPP